MKVRIISSIFLLLIYAVLLYFCYLGYVHNQSGITQEIFSLIYSFMILPIALLMFHELLNLKKNLLNKFFYVLFYALLLFCIFYHFVTEITKHPTFNTKAWISSLQISTTEILVLLIVLLPLPVFTSKINFLDSIYIFGVVLLITLIYKSFIYISLIHGWWTILYLTVIIFSTDIFAMIGGKYFGKRKAYPRISPNKTVEGAVIATICGTLFGFSYFLINYAMVRNYHGDDLINQLIHFPWISNFDNWYTWLLVLFYSFVVSLFAQIGDLVFSALKRNFNVKDLSHIIPGHGGILDRLDSLSFVCLFYGLLLIISFHGNI